MHFVVDASMPRASANLLRDHAHTAVDVRDVGLADAPDDEVFALAVREDAHLLTRDFDFADTRLYPPAPRRGVIVVAAPPTAGRLVVLRMVEALLDDDAALGLVAGRLVIVEPARLRMRPPA